MISPARDPSDLRVWVCLYVQHLGPCRQLLLEGRSSIPVLHNRLYGNTLPIGDALQGPNYLLQVGQIRDNKVGDATHGGHLRLKTPTAALLKFQEDRPEATIA